MSIPRTFRFEAAGFKVLPLSIASFMSRSASIDALKISEPPWAIPVSMIRSGLIDQTSSYTATISWGYWIIGRPCQEKLYEYFGRVEEHMKSDAALRSS